MSFWKRAQSQIVTRPHLAISAWTAFTGMSAVINGGLIPDSMETALPVWLVQVWTWAIALGGLWATFGCLADNSRTESIGLGLIVYGVGLYGVVFLVAAWPASFALSVTCAAIISMCLVRMRVLSLSRKAIKRASEGTDGAE